MITYCTNIHPGESWEETFRNIADHLPAVKAAVSPNTPFPVGLRLSHRAAAELDDLAVSGFSDWLREHDLFVPTINGFPYGSFHAARVKEQVYLPDWLQKDRGDYTMRLATLLDSWLPEGIRGSISTVPVGFRGCISERDLDAVRSNLVRTLEHLDRLRQKSGKIIVLSLEPEPACVLETTGDVVEFFERMQFPGDLRDGIGVCFDCCHQAVEFENPGESLARLGEAGIGIGKVQISSALRMIDPERALLEGFSEQTYLHQVVIRDRNETLWKYVDLSDALKEHPSGRGEEWRIHFHLPIFVERMPRYGTTRFFIDGILPLLDDKVLLEVETYTWDVLPPELQEGTVTRSIIQELRWLKGQRDETDRRP